MFMFNAHTSERVIEKVSININIMTLFIISVEFRDQALLNITCLPVLRHLGHLARHHSPPMIPRFHLTISVAPILLRD